jgi:hypothetical protein
MKTAVLAALIASVPLGVVVGMMFKLDARARKRPSRSGFVFIAVGSLVCFAGMSTLVFALGGFEPEADSGPGPEPILSLAPAPAPTPAPASAAASTPATAPASAPPAPALGSATLSWVAPRTNANGAAVRDLAGYRIYYGMTSGKYSALITVSDPAVTTHTIDALPAGTYYFIVKAYDKKNAESAASPEVSKTIR